MENTFNRAGKDKLKELETFPPHPIPLLRGAREELCIYFFLFIQHSMLDVRCSTFIFPLSLCHFVPLCLCYSVV